MCTNYKYMDYDLLKDVIKLIEKFDKVNTDKKFSSDLQGFKDWISQENQKENTTLIPDWENKEKGRSIDSVINTLLIHISRFAKSYSKSAIAGSEFTSQEEFIYLINLQAYGQMTKTALIKRNVHEKTSGMLIINRLIAKGWVEQVQSTVDKRNKLISITKKGLALLNQQMENIRHATNLVVGDLTAEEKLELVRLLNKLNDFHLDIYHSKTTGF